MVYKKTLLVIGVVIGLLRWNSFAADSTSSPNYFRSDRGVALTIQPLFSDPSSPAAFRWRTPIHGGQSSPTVGGDYIFLTTFDESSRALTTLALARHDGRIVWQQSARIEKIEEYHRTSGSPATASVAWDGTNVFSFFGSVGLLCYDVRGNLLWKHAMGPFQDEYGAGSSPILFQDLVLLNQDHDVDSFIIAIDRYSGKIRWKSPRPDAVRSYSTPVLWSQGNRTDLLIAGSLALTAYDPLTGARRWWMSGLARIVIPVPVPVGDKLYIASWAPGGDSGKRISLPAWSQALDQWDTNQDSKLSRTEIQDREVLDRFFRMDINHDESLVAQEWERHAAVFQQAQNAVLAIHPGSDPTGELPPGSLLWKHLRGVPYVASPVIYQQRFWMVKEGGIVTQLDPNSGRVILEERLPVAGGYYASPVAGDGKIYFASESGVLSVVTNSSNWQVLGTHDFKEKIHATPSWDDNRLLIRTDKAIYSLGQ